MKGKEQIFQIQTHVISKSIEWNKYRIHVIWAPLLNRTPPIEYSNTTPAKTPVLGQKLAKIGQIEAKF